jgi:hypothetical protein
MVTKRSSVVVRRYVADSHELALEAYESDLPDMAGAGWFPVAQSWGWDTTSSAGWLVGGSSWKPGPGTLAVTYRFEGTLEDA